MISNNQLKIYRSLKSKKYRKIEGKFLIEGSNLCEAALESSYSVELLLMSESFSEDNSNRHILNRIKEKKIRSEIVKEKIVDSLSESVSPQGIVAAIESPELDIEKFWDLKAEEVLVLDRISDPGNLGTILRSAAWFGIKAVLCSSDCVDLYNGKVLRSSAGSIFQLPLILDDLNIVEVVSQLKKNKYSILIADSNTNQSYMDTPFSRPFALVVGSERQGVRSEIQSSGKGICIPNRGKAESLNVAIATSILLAEAFRK
jgi:RNA methyltransferase, TrmH family